MDLTLVKREKNEMGRAFRSPWPVVMFVIASLVTVSTGGCGGGGADKANVTPVTLPTVSAPAAVQPAGKVVRPILLGTDRRNLRPIRPERPLTSSRVSKAAHLGKPRLRTSQGTARSQRLNRADPDPRGRRTERSSYRGWLARASATSPRSRARP